MRDDDLRSLYDDATHESTLDDNSQPACQRAQKTKGKMHYIFKCFAGGYQLIKSHHEKKTQKTTKKGGKRC